jgi:hypothetical protein
MFRVVIRMTLSADLVSDILEIAESLMVRRTFLLPSLSSCSHFIPSAHVFSMSMLTIATVARSENSLMMALQDIAAKSSTGEMTSTNHPA